MIYYEWQKFANRTTILCKGKLIVDLKNISKSTPIEPDIELDGGYAYCLRCLHEVEPTDNICPECGQCQDWSWFTKNNEYGGSV